MPDPIVYQAPEREAPCTVEAVERCLQREFALDDIAIVMHRIPAHWTCPKAHASTTTTT
jgi:hypothetical protein